MIAGQPARFADLLREVEDLRRAIAGLTGQIDQLERAFATPAEPGQSQERKQAA